MKKTVRLIGLTGMLIGAGFVFGASAQEASQAPAQPQPNIGLTLTETLNKLAPSASSKDDLREIPKPKNDKLSDTVRITVSVGDGQCLPGEDGWVSPRTGRRVRVR
jgi:hypothetical protein